MQVAKTIAFAWAGLLVVRGIVGLFAAIWISGDTRRLGARRWVRVAWSLGDLCGLVAFLLAIALSRPASAKPLGMAAGVLVLVVLVLWGGLRASRRFLPALYEKLTAVPDPEAQTLWDRQRPFARDLVSGLWAILLLLASP